MKKVLIALLLGSLAGSFSAQAANDEVAQLRAQLEALQKRVDALERDIDIGIAINPARKVKPQPGGWKNPDNWKLIAKGMEPHRVREILGQPSRIRDRRTFDYWEYPKGQLTFYGGRVKSIKPPAGL